MDKTVAIRALNDAFRRSFEGGQAVMTTTVAALPSDMKAVAIYKVVTFTDFTPDNDPRGEHDFGAFELSGHKFFWKIDYYDRRLEFGSENPADAEKTTRVLTLMLAEEY